MNQHYLLPLLSAFLLPLALACGSGSGNDASRSAGVSSPTAESSATPAATATPSVTSAAVPTSTTLAPTANAPATAVPTLAAQLVPTATPAVQPQGALSSAPAPAAAGGVQGSVNLSTAASCSSTNGVATAKLTARATASGGFVRRVTILMDDVLVSDSGDVSGQSLSTLERVADLTPSAGTHSVRIVGESTGGGTTEKTGTLTIVNGGCSLRI